MIPVIVYDILDILAVLIRFAGLILFGLGIGWFAMNTSRKNIWQLQVAVFLGFLGLAAVLAKFLTAGAFGAYVIGAGVAIFLWGKQKVTPEEED
ncbi:MAG: hypothetical protein JXA13_04330 [Anaerolineales bacterium]|nr:hypothetical protein [Anaerolineales bacterium]